MQNLYWFNPENDIALGRGCNRFTPPRQAALLAQYGAPLMWWLGDKHDYMLVQQVDEQFDAWQNVLEQRFGAGPRAVLSLDGIALNELKPWGWSAYTVTRLRSMGATDDVLAPRMARVEKMRMLSHRRTASEVNRRLATEVDYAQFGMCVPEAAFEAFNEVDCYAFMREHERFYLKSPWSSSGRGVVSSLSASQERLLQRAMSVIREQGSVMFEPAHEKVADFAMLFYADAGGKVTLHGYSRFFNARGAAYEGNMIASDEEIKCGLSEFVPSAVLDATESALQSVLTDILQQGYCGFLGVDMMIAQDALSRKIYLVPCVEVNLRMTMGVVAHAVYDRMKCRGVMRIAPRADIPLTAVPLVPANSHFSIFFEPE